MTYKNTWKLPVPLTTAATNLHVSIQLQYITNSHPLPHYSHVLIIDFSEQKWLILQQKCPSIFYKISAKIWLSSAKRVKFTTAADSKNRQCSETSILFYFTNTYSHGIHSWSEFNTSTEKGKGEFLCNTIWGKLMDIIEYCLLFWLQRWIIKYAISSELGAYLSQKCTTPLVVIFDKSIIHTFIVCIVIWKQKIR